MKEIGWISVGIMGRSMIHNLMKADFELHIYTRTKAKVEGVIHGGAIFHETIRDCVEGYGAVITMIGFPRDVEEIYFAENNILSDTGVDVYLVDMTTISPALVKKLGEAGTARRYHIIDAPVTGGDRGAHSRTLSIMVGDERKDYEACLPLFRAMGENIRHHGKAGCDQHTKPVNQVIIAGTLSGICEALAHTKIQGPDLQTVFSSVSTGSAASRQLSPLAPKTMDDDYAPGFFLEHFIRDMKLALERANVMGLDLAVLRQALSNSKELEDAGHGDLGTQALIRHYKQ